MIRRLLSSELNEVIEYISKDYARNYFIAVGLVKGNVFKDIYIDEVKGDIKAVLFHRKSNNLQFCSYGDFDSNGFIEVINSLEFNYLISPNSFCEKLKPALILEKKGALISKLDESDFIDANENLDYLRVEDLDEVLEIYKAVFTGYPSKEFIRDKIISKRGRGVCAKENGKIVSVAQSEFETEHSSLIVGVATDVNHQNKGYGSSCVKALIKDLLQENKSVYLQYDNPDAGKIYTRIGFKEVDQVYHYKKG